MKLRGDEEMMMEAKRGGAPLVKVRKQREAADAAKAARHAAAERKVDTRRKIVLGGAVLALMRANAEFREMLKLNLPAMAAERDRLVLARLFDDLEKQP